MSAATRLAATRRALAAVLVARATLWGAAVAAAAYVGGAALAVPRGPALAAAVVVGAVVAAVLLAGLRRKLAPASVALWIERRTPALDYALVTLADRAPRGAFAELLEQRVARARWGGAVARRGARTAALPLALLALVLLAGSVLGGEAGAASRAAAAGPAAASRGPARRDPLASLRATITPPAYARRPVRETREPAAVRELPGATIVVRGDGGGVTARLGAAGARVAEDGAGWRVAVAMPPRPAALTLTGGARTRIVVLEPEPDSAPAVELLAPARDSVLRAPAGRITLGARARDDVGLARGGFEYIVSSGSGESFTFRSGRLGDRAFGGARAGALDGLVDLAALALKPGDVVHVRAVATDGNTVSGPGSGASETRTLRIARPGEYDSLAVEAAAPPAVDKSIVSQRMLITLTEALERRRPRLARPELVRESRRIAADQARLRRAVSDIVFTRLGGEPSGEHAHFDGDGHAHAEGTAAGPLSPEELLKAADRATGRGTAGALDNEGDETPVVAVNRPLLEAYNAMWDAGRELEAAEPARALPPMRRALAAIQRARQAERVYLRGRPPAVVVDVARVRLQGVDKGAANVRQPRPPADDPAVRLGARLTRALARLGAAPAAAIDSLTLLRVDALGAAPALAAALGDAVERLREGRDATEALGRARRAAGVVPSAPAPLGAWGRE